MFNEEWNLETALEVRYEEGVEIGMEKKASQTALKMKAKGFNTAVICEITGLSEDEIDRL